MSRLIAGMSVRQPVRYTVRGVPPGVDARLREVAATEGVSLNQTTLRALTRGLGMDGTAVRQRSLRHLVSAAPKSALKAWRKALQEQDRVNPDDWR